MFATMVYAVFVLVIAHAIAGPRAGINWNDGAALCRSYTDTTVGFYGANIIQGNLVFNCVRETGDVSLGDVYQSHVDSAWAIQQLGQAAVSH